MTSKIMKYILILHLTKIKISYNINNYFSNNNKIILIYKNYKIKNIYMIYKIYIK
jgi:hypothetical protein